MRALLIVIVLVLIGALVGWITFSNSDSTATIRIDKQEIKQDTEQAAHNVEEAAERAVDATRKAVDGDEKEEIDQRNEEATEPQVVP